MGVPQQFFRALEDNRARLSLILGRRSLSEPPTQPAQFANRLRERLFGFSASDGSAILNTLRQIKTPYEQDIMRKSVGISSDAHLAGMRAAAAGRNEYEVESAIEAVYLKNGAMKPGYDSIVGSGPNSTVLHYHESIRLMQDGDVLLVDAAGSYQGYTDARKRGRQLRRSNRVCRPDEISRRAVPGRRLHSGRQAPGRSEG